MGDGPLRLGPEGPAGYSRLARSGMHNRNPVVSDSEVVYFEYGNNGQPDLYFWTYGTRTPRRASAVITPR